jgi:hypothetical protein
MNPTMLPFNIELLMLTSNDVKAFMPVKVLDIFNRHTKDFHSEGLFSTERFGKVGEERRNRSFSYIDLGIPVMHPVLFTAICDLKELYGDILAGKAWGVYDETSKDVVKATADIGQTGYSWMLSMIPKIKFEDRPAASRVISIKLVQRYINDLTYDKLAVIPAGIRDYVIDENGKPSEDDVNSIYRKVLSLSSVMSGVNVSKNESYMDTPRYQLQLAVVEIYNYYKEFLEGKNGFIQSKWAGRKTYNSTRNVITSYTQTPSSLDDPTTPGVNDTIAGLYQVMRAALPICIHSIRDGFISKVFTSPNTPAIMVDKDMKKCMVTLDADYYDMWMTNEGLEKVMAKFSEEHIRHEYLKMGGYYFGLVYKGEEDGLKVFKFFNDISEVPEDRLATGTVTFITMVELLYISVVHRLAKVPALVTRYPIAGLGSIYPSTVYLKTTTKSEVRYELDDQWSRTTHVVSEYPIYGEPFFNSMCPNTSHIGRLAADFDGDVCSFTSPVTEDSITEIAQKLNSADFYVGIKGQMNYSLSTEVINLVLSYITGDA